MARQIRRFLFPRGDEVAEAIEQAVAQVSRLSAELGPEQKEALLLLPSKKDLKEHAYYEKIFDGPERKALNQVSKISREKNVTWEVASFKTFESYAVWDFVVILFPNEDMLDRVEDVLPRFIIVVPWVQDSVTEWRRVYDPEGPDQKNNCPYQVELDEVVERELERLTSVCLDLGWQSMFTHPLDEDKVKHAIKDLRKKRRPLDPLAIEIYVRRAGWMPQDAKRLARIAKGRSTA